MAAVGALDQLLNQLHFQNRSRVKTDVVNLIASFKALNPRIGTLIQNNGATLRVLDFEGTIPIVYAGTQYNIPIQLYLTEAYPQIAPQIYVRPTANMIIKPNHKNVDGEGLVYLPYLFNWNPNSANLRELTTILCNVFGQEPPLFSRPTQPVVQATPLMNSYPAPTPAVTVTATSVAPRSNPNPIPNPIPNMNTNPNPIPNPNPSQYDRFLSPSTHSGSQIPSSNPIPPPPPYPTMATSVAVQKPVPVSIPDHLKVQQAQREKEQLVREVTSKLHETILLTQTRIKGEIDEDLHTQFELSLSRERVEQARRDLISMREQYQNAIETIKEKDRTLDKWVEQKELQLSQTGAVDSSVESKWIPYDDLTVQLVRLQSDYLAMDDAMYYLDRALASHSNRTVDLNAFLRETRKLAREQFLCKAHIRKIQNQISLSYR